MLFYLFFFLKKNKGFGGLYGFDQIRLFSNSGPAFYSAQSPGTPTGQILTSGVVGNGLLLGMFNK